MRALIGRDEEQAVLRGVVDEAFVGGRLRAAVVVGATGMGASALAGLAVRDGLRRGADVLRARADPVQRAIPGGVAIATGWMPAGGTASDLVAAIAARADRSPVVVVIEHLHDVDSVTVAALQHVVARLASRPVALIVTTRDASIRPGAALVADIADTGGPILTLEPLDDERCIELAEHELGARCGPKLRRLVARTGGVPVAVVALIEALRREGRVEIRGGIVDVESDDVPVSVRDGVLRYLADVPRPTLDVLQVAATIGPVIDLGDLALVLGRSLSDVVHDLAPPGIGSILEHNGPIAWFRHELLRDALYDSMSPALRAAVHAEIASVLAAAGKPPAVIARHVVAADGVASPAVAADAAWALRRDSPALALDVATVALDGGVDAADVRDRLATAALWPLLVQGGLADVEARARELLGRPHDPGLDVELSWCLVAALQRQGQVAAGRDALVAALERGDLDPGDRAFLLARLAVAHVLTGDLRAAEALGDDLLADPNVVGDPDVGVAARAAKIFARLTEGDVTAANVLAGDVAQLLEHDALSSREGMGVILPTTLIEADRFDDARAALADAARADAGRGDPSVVSVYDVWLVVVDALAGAWDDAVATADAVRQAVDEDGGAAVVALYALGYPAVVHLRRDGLERADELVTIAERTLEAYGPQNGADIVLWARSLVHEARGSMSDAAALLALEWDLTETVRYFHSWRSVAPDLVRLSLAVGDRTRAGAVTEVAEEGARRADGVPSALGAALRCRGLLDGDLDALVAAVDAFRGSPRRPDLVLAAEDAAVALAGAGRRADAVAMLADGRAVAAEMGARRDIRRIESRLARLGAPPRRTRRDAVATGWDSLTAREADVAALVADGLSNPQIADRLLVSRHTVESHLKRIFVKLGATSRGQLAAEALRRANT